MGFFGSYCTFMSVVIAFFSFFQIIMYCIKFVSCYYTMLLFFLCAINEKETKQNLEVICSKPTQGMSLLMLSHNLVFDVETRNEDRLQTHTRPSLSQPSTQAYKLTNTSLLSISVRHDRAAG